LESTSAFRLIPHWNQFPISGSFVDWKMLRLAAKVRRGCKMLQREVAEQISVDKTSIHN
jgi:hypothetical protein